MTSATPNHHDSAGPPDAPRAVLEFRHADFPSLPRRYGTVGPVNLTLRGGECALVVTPPGAESLPLADAALGLVAPRAGEVCFLSDDWTRLGVREQLARRGRIGRVFEHAAWINNLSVRDNVLLPRQHHTALGLERLLADARHWARRFGLAGVSAERPSSLPGGELRLAEWVRAFSLEPDLLLLEHPTRGAPRERIADLLAAVAEARTRGAAVLWLASEAEALLAGPGASCYALRNQTLVAA
jgi:phospholipid/cholesterol/gamma-HCH transport system ATP-binding protein